MGILDLGKYKRSFLQKLERDELRRALIVLRQQDTHPRESNPVAAQYDGLATSGSVKAEYRRRGWKVPIGK
jgi:hypothetical protein